MRLPVRQQVAADLRISDQTIDNWRRQQRMDAGLEPGITSRDRPSRWPPGAGSRSPWA
ncbi:hypothetical protein ACFYYP_34970 [Microbispora rosea]|uniref:hypothetical protein n=1 Tax=Microbispora rosea TaxID=58117 RepID=UPI0036A4CDFF